MGVYRGHSGGCERHQPLVLVALAALAGVVTDRALAISPGLWLAAVVGCLAAWWLALRQRPRCGTWVVLAATSASAGLYHHGCWNCFAADDLGLRALEAPQPVAVEVTARSSPRRHAAPPADPFFPFGQGDRWESAVSVLRVWDRGGWQRASGQLLVSFEGSPPAMRPGDWWRMNGLLVAPRRALNPGEVPAELFDRAERRLGRLIVAHRDGVELVARGSSWRFAWRMDALRRRCDELLWRHVSPARAGLASALLLGTREQIDVERNHAFMVTGTSHVLSISGLHVGVLAYGLWGTVRLGVCRRRVVLWAAMLFVAGYTILTSAQPPVVRAAVLITLSCAAQLSGREALSYNTLALAGLIVLIVNPATLFHAGTQLSFLAVAVMIQVAGRGRDAAGGDPLERLIDRSRPWPWRAVRRVVRGTGKALWLSTAIWLVSLPLVLSRFHVVSLVATWLNPIVCIPMSVALFAGIGVLCFGGWISPLAVGCGWLCDVGLWAMEGCIRLALRVPGGHVWGPAPAGWWVIGFYVAWAGQVAAPFGWVPRRWRAAGLACWLAVGGWLTFGPAAREDLQGSRLVCTFVAVGHGTSVLLEFPGGRTLLYDAGRLGSSASAGRPIASVLWSRGITHLDALVVSHADADHFNAVPYLLERFTIGVVYVAPGMFEKPGGAVAVLRRALASFRIPVVRVSRGDRLVPADRTRVSVLHPPPEGVGGNDNANSIVLAVEFRGQRILLPGDLESPGLERLLGSPRWSSQVLMAPHHGSAHSDPAGFAEWASPDIVVISGGRGRESTAVRRSYEARGARVLHTAADGAVQITLAGGPLRIYCAGGAPVSGRMFSRR